MERKEEKTEKVKEKKILENCELDQVQKLKSFYRLVCSAVSAIGNSRFERKVEKSGNDSRAHTYSKLMEKLTIVI